jgi:hypothetical protein
MIAPISETTSDPALNAPSLIVGSPSRRDDETCDQRADDADDDVQSNALLRVRAHDHAGDPSEKAADNEPYDQVNHDMLLCNELKPRGERRGEAVAAASPPPAPSSSEHANGGSCAYAARNAAWQRGEPRRRATAQQSRAIWRT